MRIHCISCIVSVLVLVTNMTTTKAVPIQRPVLSSIQENQSISKRHLLETEEFCEETQMCGVALYDLSHRITEYKRNARCSCNDGYRCVLTGNMSSRSAYVFKCRENEISTNMYPFPQDVVNHFG